MTPWRHLLTALMCLSLIVCSFAPPSAASSVLEIKGNHFFFHMSADSFQRLSYEQRSEWLAEQTFGVMAYAQRYTKCTDVVEILSRLRVVQPGEIEIVNQIDSKKAGEYRQNILFSTNLPHFKKQEDLLREKYDFLTEIDEEMKDVSFEEISGKLYGFSDTEARQPQFTIRGKSYMERAMIYRDIAASAGGRESSDETGRMQALLDWTYVNVSNHFVREIPGGPNYYDFNDIPLELMLRGMGDCDRSAWVLATLAFHIGLESHVVFLYRTRDDIQSFHTVAEIKVDDAWVTVDPYNHKLYTKNVYELSKTDTDFRNSCVLLNPVEPHAFLPVMSLAELICRFYIPDQRLFFSIDNAAAEFAGELLGPKTKPVYVNDLSDKIFQKISKKSAASFDNTFYIDQICASRWDYPFWLRAYYMHDIWSRMKKRMYPFLDDLRQARTEQLLGHYEQAELLFSYSPPTVPDLLLFYEERDYFVILNHYFQKKLRGLASEVSAFQEKHPGSPHMKILKWIVDQSSNSPKQPHGAAKAGRIP